VQSADGSVPVGKEDSRQRLRAEVVARSMQRALRLVWSCTPESSACLTEAWSASREEERERSTAEVSGEAMASAADASAVRR